MPVQPVQPFSDSSDSSDSSAAPAISASAFFPASWRRCWRGLQAQGDGQALLDQLLACYREPHRAYHSLQHLHECLHGFEQAQSLAMQPHEVEIALWFHDALYDVKRHDNEEKSAAWAEQALLAAGVSADAAARVGQLVLATRHTALPVLPDAQLLVDIDLSILGAGPERFAQYEAQIRTEYAFVPGLVFGFKRRAILRSFLERARLYATPHFFDRLESRARANLQKAIA